MGMLWTDNSWRDRLTRLLVKVGGSPVLPVLGWTKVVESLVADGPVVLWLGTALGASLWFVIAEDAIEYVAGEDITLQEWLDR